MPENLSSETEFYVYGLYDPADKFPFYIGKGKDNRMFRHTKTEYMERTNNEYKNNKIRKIRREGRSPFAKVICGGITEVKAYNIEWALLHILNVQPECNLTNLNFSWGRGAGSGKAHPLYGKEHSTESKKKMSISHQGKSLSDEHKRKIGEASKNQSLSEENKRKLIESRKGAKHSEHTKKLISQKKTGQTYGPQSDEHKRKISEANRGERGTSKLSKKEASEVKYLATESGLTQKEIGTKYNISRSVVSRIKTGKRWGHIEPIKPN